MNEPGTPPGRVVPWFVKDRAGLTIGVVRAETWFRARELARRVLTPDAEVVPKSFGPEGGSSSEEIR